LVAVRHPALIAVVAVLVVLGALGGAVLIFEHQADGKIADGVTIGGVDVAGLTPKQARAKVRAELLTPLDEPVVVRRGERTWRLTPEQAKIRANINGMVAAAVKRSESGNVLQRAWREATGGEIDATIPAKVTFSKRAVKALVARVEGAVNTEPKDASVSFTSVSVTTVPGKPGRALNAAALEKRIMLAIAEPGAKRTFRATTRTVQPKVTLDNLAEKYPVALTVDRRGFKLRLWKNLKLAKTYGIAVGKVGMETPEGLYHIQNKAVDPAWHVPNSAWAGDLAGQVIPGGAPNNPIRARWMGIYDGAGIHGTTDDASIGSAASHGCIRMHIPEVEELYDEVPVNAPVYIA